MTSLTLKFPDHRVFEVKRTAEAENHSYATHQIIGEYTITQIDVHQLPADIYIKLSYAPTIENSTDQLLLFDYHDDTYEPTCQGGVWLVSFGDRGRISDSLSFLRYTTARD